MYLSRVEMTGFKSFADKTTIEFDQGLTAVVGPNGSGKSNLSEAVRWVLGEQSAKSLRGTKMEDVIFNGTQNRKPVNIAKVTLVLNNEDRYLDYDFSEISIARSYNRNGDSSYFINNERVRLKDVVDLFLDSGLGKNSFSIISQGQVEQIFLNKPEERRTIFEEAAGVQKYQYRKTEAERKLERSSDNLSRVRDIIHELKSQLEPLKKQRDAALIYEEKMASLKELEVSLYTEKIQLYREEWDEFEAKLDQLKQDIAQYQASQVALNTQLSGDKQEQDDIIEAIDQVQHQMGETGRELERAIGRKQIVEKDMEFAESSQADRTKVYEEQVAELAQLQERLEEVVESEASLGQTLAEDNLALEDWLQQKSQLQVLKPEEVEELRNHLIDLYQEQAQLNNQLTQYQRDIERLTQSEAKYQQEAEADAKQEEQLKAEEAQLQGEVAAVKAQIQAMEGQLLDNRSGLSKMQSDQQAMENQLFQLEREIQRSQSRVSSLQQMQDSYSGFYAGVRALMKQAQQIPGIHGPVADIISVEPAYAKAIEVALGGSLQHIVVEDEGAARAGVNYLHQSRQGRATFLPLTQIQPRSLSGQFLSQAQGASGFIDVAANLVTSDSQYQAVLANLLGNTLVVEELSQAQAIARLLGQRVKIVTLQGDLLMPGGSVTGGRYKQEQGSVLSRQQELETAEADLSRLQADLAKLERAVEANRQGMIDESTGMQGLEGQLNRHRQQLQELTEASQGLSMQLRQLNSRQVLRNSDYAADKEELELAQSALVTNESALDALEDEIRSRKEQLDQHHLNQDERQERLQEIDQRINQLQTQIAVKGVEQRQIQENRRQLSQQSERLQSSLDHYLANQDSGTANIENLKVELVELETGILRLSEENEQLDLRLSEQRTRRQELSASIRQLEEDSQNMNIKLNDLIHQESRLESKIERNQTLIDNHLNHLNQEYQLTYEMAVQIAQPVESQAKLAETVKKLRSGIQKLGPINLQSIEDYEQLNERYTHLVEQETDLLSAMDQLKQTMDEMDHEVVSRFGTTFKEINQQFQSTFTKLFGGGEAYLTLTQPDDLLTTGIDIIAQPPGKKKQNLALLSGGERALTAIALLFAILEVKPIPFVILDEVEAALDDANVYRYGSYINTFTQDTQFIVITHRKGTMEQADRLYGVTMEKSGVSKLASVKMADTVME